MTLAELTRLVREFAAEREWERFHTPKNLAMAVGAEAGELLAEFQWLAPGEEPDMRAVTDEMADVLIYLVRMADVLDVDLLAAAADKVEANQARYTVERSKGHARKVR